MGLNTLHTTWLNVYTKSNTHTHKETYQNIMLVTQSCPTLGDPMDCNSPGSSVCGILHAKILERVTISFSRRSYWPRNQTWVSCIADRCFTISATRKAHQNINCHYSRERVKTQIFIFSYLFAVFSNLYTMMNYLFFSLTFASFGEELSTKQQSPYPMHSRLNYLWLENI